MTSPPDNLFDPSCTTKFIIEADKITIKTKWTQNLLMILDVFSIYFLAYVTIGSLVEINIFATLIYFVAATVFIVTYKRIIVVNGIDRCVFLSKRILVPITYKIDFENIVDLIVTPKKRQIAGTKGLLYECHYLYFTLTSGKKIFIDRSNDKEYMLQCRQKIIDFISSTTV